MNDTHTHRPARRWRPALAGALLAAALLWAMPAAPLLAEPPDHAQTGAAMHLQRIEQAQQPVAEAPEAPEAPEDAEHADAADVLATAIEQAAAYLTPQRIGELDSAASMIEHAQLIRLVAPQSEQLPAEALGQALIQGPLARDALVAELRHDQLNAVRQTLAVLGASATNAPDAHLTLLDRWVRHSPHREQLDAGEAAALVRAYQSLVQAVAAAQEDDTEPANLLTDDPRFAGFRSFVEHSHWRFLTRLPDDAEALAQVQTLARTLENHLDQEQRQGALEHLQQTLLANDAALRRMTVAQFRQAILLGSTLGVDERGQHESLLRFVEQSQTLDEASSIELTFVADFLRYVRRVEGDQLQRRAAQGQTKVLTLVVQRLAGLVDEEHPRNERFELVVLMRAAFDAGDESHQQQIVSALSDLLDDPARAAETLDGPVGRFLQGNLDGMGDAELTQRVLSAYLEGSDRWHEADGSRLPSFYTQLSPPLRDRARDARQRVLNQASTDLDRLAGFLSAVRNDEAMLDPTLLEHVQRRMPALIETQQTLTAATLAQLARFFAAHPEPEQGRRWLLELLTAHLERDGELVGAFTEFRAFAAIAVEFELDEQLRQLAVTPEGGVRLGVAQVLAWVHSDRESMHAWRAYLEEAAAQPNFDGDEHARWLLARAYAALVPPAELSAIVGLNWIEQAFAAAESEALRLETLVWLIEQRLGVHDFQGAQAVLASVRHQFGSDEAQQRIAALTEQVRERWQAQQQRELRVAHQRELRRMTAQIQAMQRRLEQAREQNRPAQDITSLENLVAAMERELEEARNATP